MEEKPTDKTMMRNIDQHNQEKEANNNFLPKYGRGKKLEKLFILSKREMLSEKISQVDQVLQIICQLV